MYNDGCGFWFKDKYLYRCKPADSNVQTSSPYLCDVGHLLTLGVEECRAVGDSHIQPRSAASRKTGTQIALVFKEKLKG